MAALQPLTETFDFSAEAELYPGRRQRPGHGSVGYRRFGQAAQAVRFAIEELSPQLLVGACLEVGELRFDSHGIRRLYDSADYPLARHAADDGR